MKHFIENKDEKKAMEIFSSYDFLKDLIDLQSCILTQQLKDIHEIDNEILEIKSCPEAVIAY